MVIPCNRPGCPELIASHRMFCPSHWGALPRAMRAQINRAWRQRLRGEGEAAHEQAKAAAIRYLQEGRGGPVIQGNLW